MKTRELTVTRVVATVSQWDHVVPYGAHLGEYYRQFGDPIAMEVDGPDVLYTFAIDAERSFTVRAKGPA